MQHFPIIDLSARADLFSDLEGFVRVLTDELQKNNGVALLELGDGREPLVVVSHARVLQQLMPSIASAKVNQETDPSAVSVTLDEGGLHVNIPADAYQAASVAAMMSS